MDGLIGEYIFNINKAKIRQKLANVSGESRIRRITKSCYKSKITMTTTSNETI